jgi:spore germination protein
MDNQTPITKSLSENLAVINNLFKDCDDIKTRKMKLGSRSNVDACLFYVEVAINNITIEESVIGKLLSRLWDMTPSEQYQYLDENALGITDVKELPTMEEAVMGVMIGDAVLFIDGYDKAIKIKSVGYPFMGVQESKNEQVLRGSREGFTDSEKANTALIRKRIRNPELKVKEKILGRRSKTNVAIVYLEGIVRKEVLDEINGQLEAFEVDGMMDSGIIEQLMEKYSYSPFPQYQTTERPDKAATAILDGRIVLLVDNSPVGLILPVSYNNFFQAADDYNSRWQIVSFVRILRYVASFIAMGLPALYISIVNFHPEIIPTNLLLSFVAARQGVPFPAVIEVLLMELSFELIREAGVRIPGPMGSTIGIIGGLIIGQAAVEANVVSPIIVIIVAITALSTFAIPSQEFVSAFRLIKYFMIVLSAFMGLYGFVLAGLVVIIHLAGLESFNFPYLSPMSGADVNGYQDQKDSIIRFPLKKIFKRSIYSSPQNRRKLK